MTGWTEHQKQKAQAGREAIQKQISQARAARKRRKLDEDEKARAARLKELINGAKAGEFIANKTLKRWLSKQQFNSIAELWDDEQRQREQWKEKPDEIKEYEERLKQALFVYNRADVYSQTGKHKTASKLMNEADGLFERMLERLQEITHADPSLASWFDRDLDFSYNGNLGLNPDQIPRVRTSRSLTNQSVGFTGARRTIADIKLSVLEEALDDLIYENDDKPALASPKLRDLLRGNDEDDD